MITKIKNHGIGYRKTINGTPTVILDETARKYVYTQTTATLYNYFKNLDIQYIPQVGNLREFCDIVFVLCGKYLERECSQAMKINDLPERQRKTYETPLKAITLEEIELFLKSKVEKN